MSYNQQYNTNQGQGGYNNQGQGQQKKKYEHKPGRASAFPNNKRTPKDPDFSGTGKLENGEEVRIAIWNGPNGRLDISVGAPRQSQNANQGYNQAPQQAPQQGYNQSTGQAPQGNQGNQGNFDDSIPF